MKKEIDFAKTIFNLNAIKRYNTMFSNLNETVAAHSFNVAIITLKLHELYKSDYKLNLNKMLKMALIHDVGELETGDIVYSTKKNHPEVKKILDEIEQEYILKLLGKNYKSTIKEFEERKTSEAILVKIADIISSHIYGLQEVKSGNKEFKIVVKRSKASLNKLYKQLKDARK